VDGRRLDPTNPTLLTKRRQKRIAKRRQREALAVSMRLTTPQREGADRKGLLPRRTRGSMISSTEPASARRRDSFQRALREADRSSGARRQTQLDWSVELQNPSIREGTRELIGFAELDETSLLSRRFGGDSIGSAGGLQSP
jgi:hypothetical protein